PAEVAPLLAHGVGLPIASVEIALARLSYGVVPITPDIVAQQQAIADEFQALHLIPTKVDVAKDVWQPPS
ncbi:MAG: aliphatic sulfonate ABC transporter substrate-binding protein, partial [Janthinobacterium lividum]